MLALAMSGASIVAGVALLWSINPYQRAAMGIVWDTVRGVDRPPGETVMPLPIPPDAGAIR